MRKLFTIALALVIASAASAAFADEYVKGGFEMSAVLNTGLGFQFNNTNSQSALTPVINQGGAANQYGPVNPGPLGEFQRYNSAAGGAFGKFAYQFYTDGVQLSLSKSFGENIRARVDLAFGNVAYGSSTSYANAGANIAQAYVTANIPAGNGMEFLAGHFFVPFGYEKVFRNENNTVTHSVVWALRPTTFTGIKFYYGFSDLVDLHFFVYNNMRDNLSASVSKDMPGYGVTVGFNWGEEGKKSRLDVSGLAGPESWGNTTGGGDKMGNWTFLGDASWNWHINDAFSLGGEGLYRMDRDQKGGVQSKIMALVADFNYAFTDVWDGTLKLAYAHQNNVSGSVSTVAALSNANNGLIGLAGAATALRVNVIQGSLATQYQIADGAKLQGEFRFDYGKSTGTGAPGKALSYGPILNFAYAF